MQTYPVHARLKGTSLKSKIDSSNECTDTNANTKQREQIKRCRSSKTYEELEG